MDQKVPEALLEQAIRLARDAYPNEILFWLNYESQAWELFVPDQDASCGSVRPLDPYHPIGAKALVDMHSHGTFGAMFSTTDNADETGFRVYVCLGRSANEIVARIGIFGYFWEFPASWVCDLPAWIRECEAEYGC
jgi:PRTRC genetic system protein A